MVRLHFAEAWTGGHAVEEVVFGLEDVAEMVRALDQVFVLLGCLVQVLGPGDAALAVAEWEEVV